MIYEISESSGEDEERGIYAILAFVVSVLERCCLDVLRYPRSRLYPHGKFIYFIQYIVIYCIHYLTLSSS